MSRLFADKDRGGYIEEITKFRWISKYCLDQSSHRLWVLVCSPMRIPCVCKQKYLSIEAVAMHSNRRSFKRTERSGEIVRRTLTALSMAVAVAVGRAKWKSLIPRGRKRSGAEIHIRAELKCSARPRLSSFFIPGWFYFISLLMRRDRCHILNT